MYQLTIETKAEAKEGEQIGVARKGRSFSAIKLAHITADAMWAGGEAETDDVRPVWLMLAGSPHELRPFLMNLKSGRRAEESVLGEGRSSYSRSKPTRYALLKSAGYLYAHQKLATGEEIVTAYLPDLCNLDPGMIDPEVCRFLCLTPRWWSDAQLAALRADQGAASAVVAHARRIGVPGAWTDEDVLALVPQAVHVAAYLEQRTRRPIPPEPAFALQLLLAGLRAGVYSLSMTEESARGYRWNDTIRVSADPWIWGRHKWAVTFTEADTADVGLLPGVLCSVAHEALDMFLAAQVKAFFE